MTLRYRKWIPTRGFSSYEMLQVTRDWFTDFRDQRCFGSSRVWMEYRKIWCTLCEWIPTGLHILECLSQVAQLFCSSGPWEDSNTLMTPFRSVMKRPPHTLLTARPRVRKLMAFNLTSVPRSPFFLGKMDEVGIHWNPVLQTATKCNFHTQNMQK